MKIFSTLTIALLLIFQTIGFAATGTFSARGEYLMSEYDTPEIAEEIALDFAKQNAAEQASMSKAIILNPKEASLYSARGGYYLERAEFWVLELEARKKEIFSFQETQNIDPKDKDALLKRAWKNFVAERYDAAISDLNLLAALTPEISGIYYLRACCYEKLGSLKKALEDLDKAIKLKPDYSSAYEKRQELLKIISINRYAPEVRTLIECADSFRENENYSRAIEAYSRILKIDIKNEHALFWRAWCYDEMDENENALADLNKLLELNPNDAEAYINRGDAYENLGDLDKALADYNKALELNQNDETAKKHRQRVIDKLNK